MPCYLHMMQTVYFPHIMLEHLGQKKVCLFRAQWFSTFLNLRHTNFENKLGGTLYCKNETKMWKIWLFYILFWHFKIWRQTYKNSTAHLCVAEHPLRNTGLAAFHFHISTSHWRQIFIHLLLLSLPSGINFHFQIFSIFCLYAINESRFLSPPGKFLPSPGKKVCGRPWSPVLII